MPTKLSKSHFKAFHQFHKLRKVRNNAFLHQSGRCYYCELPMWIDDKEGFATKHSIPASMAEKLKCTAEHLVARCEGGGNNKSNIVAACFVCNNRRHRFKHPLSPPQYKEHVQKLLNNGNWHKKSLRQLDIRSM